MKRLSQLHPRLYDLAVEWNKLKRYTLWAFQGSKIPQNYAQEDFANLVMDHRLILLRRLGNVDMELQQNKVQNLSLAISHLDNLLIEPGQEFSLWRLIGEPTEEKGYLPGLILKGETTSQGVGGGLCQLANLIHWMVLHSPLVVTERYHHSLDFFPDNRRRIPFGTGASIFYNYFDLRFKNPTENTFQLKFFFQDNHIVGQILSLNAVVDKYRVYEKNHGFHHDGKRYFRSNEIWRETHTPDCTREEMLFKNRAKVLYDQKFIPKEYQLSEVPSGR